MGGRRGLRWWVLAACVAVGLVAAIVAYTDRRHTGDGCPAVRSLIDYTAEHARQQQAMTENLMHADDPNAQESAFLQQFARELSLRAGHIHEPGLREHAEQLATLASQNATIYARMANDVDDSDQQDPLHPPPEDPELTRKLGDVYQNFGRELTWLDHACPANH